VIRDSILAVSGQLDEKMFGPGTLDSAMKRRSIYFQIKRSQLPPMMNVFDAPDTLQSMGLRPSTTVSPQSLLLLNNELIRGVARTWAQQLAALPCSEAVSRAYRTALSREPSTQEAGVATAFLQKQAASYQGANGNEAALTDFCQTLFDLNEFLYVD
jgi:hypothetical protein